MPASPSPTRHGNADWRAPVALILGLSLWRLLLAALVPVTQDEAYYYDWARSLAWGYFDHPPGVALVGLGTLLAPGSAFAARLGAVLTGLLSLLVLWRLYLACGLRQGSGLLLALLLAATTLPGLIVGVITTPDTVLALCWGLALHEALAALQRDRRRWLTAGVATGLGLLGKYTMLVIGPVFLLALLLRDRKALASPWPYLGGLLALLVFLPNLLWNAQHDWLTLRFQFGHGFATDTGAVALAADRLPAAIGAMAYTPSAEATRDLAARLGSLAGYLGSQLLFWGALLIPLAIALLRRGAIPRIGRALQQHLTPDARALLWIGMLLPLGLFAMVALISDVEPNWSALYLTCAAPLAALVLRPIARWALAAAALNLLAVSLYGLHAATALLPLPDAADRIMRETQGYDALAAHAARLTGPVFADRYPYAAMLNFYQPGLGVAQWPGIARPSEYSRGLISTIPDPDILGREGFWLFAHKFTAPTIPGFAADQVQTLFDCKGEPLQVIDRAVGTAKGNCDQPLHVWRLYHYRPETSGPAAPDPD